MPEGFNGLMQHISSWVLHRNAVFSYTQSLADIHLPPLDSHVSVVLAKFAELSVNMKKSTIKTARLKIATTMTFIGNPSDFLFDILDPEPCKKLVD